MMKLKQDICHLLVSWFKYEQVTEQIGKKNLAKKEVETFIILW